MVWMFIIDLFGGQKKIKKILTIYDWQWWCIFSFLVFSLSICVACVEVTQPSIEKFSSGIQLIIRDEMKTRFVFVIVQSMVSWFCVDIIYSYYKCGEIRNSSFDRIKRWKKNSEAKISMFNSNTGSLSHHHHHHGYLVFFFASILVDHH